MPRKEDANGDAGKPIQGHFDADIESRFLSALGPNVVTTLTGHPPLGATYLAGLGTFFRVWAPRCRSVVVQSEPSSDAPDFPLARDGDGFFNGLSEHYRPGMKYWYRLGQGAPRPDPASRFQPQGVHGPSEIVDHSAYQWQDIDWKGVKKRDLIIYELHVGAFTKGGTFESMTESLDHLLELGVTAVELMPVAQTPGKWNWGYDGVGLFAVRNSYGHPDQFKRFVDACHQRGLAVLLDVVYNHLGPEGNYLGEFGPYFSRNHRTPWGEAWNYDGRRAKFPREMVIENAIRWLDEYHLDGLRLDAIHFVLDDSEPSIVHEMSQRVNEYTSGLDRDVHLIAESNILDRQLFSPQAPQGCEYAGLWCDDLMHSIYSHTVPCLSLTDRDYRGLADIAQALSHGYLFEYRGRHDFDREIGDYRPLEPAQIESLIMALQTHDAVGNHPHGHRFHHLTTPETQRAAAALVLLHPAIPLLFMGEEFAASSPFPFFADFEDRRLRKVVDRGRQNEYPQHQWTGALKPSDPQAFYSAQLDVAQSDDSSMIDWYRNLLSIRRRWRNNGWLDFKSLTISHDPSEQLVTLIYKPNAAIQLEVFVRLAQKDEQLETIKVRGSGKLIAHSMIDPTMASGEANGIALGANGVAIFERS